MEAAKILATYVRLLGNQWRNRDGIREIQERKIRRLVRYAYANVPYYRNLFDSAGISPGSIRNAVDLKNIPVTSKADLQERDPREITSGAIGMNDLVRERTSGSTGRPFTIFFDRDYHAMRKALFLRTLKAAKYAFGDKVLLVTGNGKSGERKRLLRWDYASILQSPEELACAVNRSRPDLLYGCVTPLKLLARHVADGGAVVHKPRKILATAESLDGETRALLKETFDAEVFEYYGMTEMGPVGWECPEHDGFHVSEDAVIVEFLPFGPDGEGSRLVMTNLDLLGMPLIRFETGDTGSPGKPGTCPCGRSFAKLERVGGRVTDCIELRDGRIVTPYRITCALEHIGGLRRYQFIQEDHERFTLRIETTEDGFSLIGGEAAASLKRILGDEARIDIVPTQDISPVPGSKFRVVESKLKQRALP